MAAGWISQPYGYNVHSRRDGLVHLGFWSLWFSAEGFAGFDRYGQLWRNQYTKTTPVRSGVLQSVYDLVRQAKRANPARAVEVLVTGHSLGGAVSW